MSTELAEINQNLTPDTHNEGNDILPPEEIVPSIDELDLDTLRLNIEQRLFESIREAGSTEEINADWLLRVLQKDYEKYLNFKLNKLDQDLFSFNKQEWVLDFKIKTYVAWYDRYENLSDLIENGLVNDEHLSEKKIEIENACFDDLIEIRGKCEARVELKIPLNKNLNRVSLSDGKVLILGDLPGKEEDNDEFLDHVFDKAESELKAYLLDITQNQEDSNWFESVLASLKNHLEKSRQESRSIERERKSCKGSFLDLTKKQKEVLSEKYEEIQVLLKEAPELLYSAITLDEIEQNVERDEELFSFAAKNLIESKISPSLFNDEGSSLLHMAVIENQPEMVRILLEVGADPFLRDLNGMSVLGLAKEEGRVNILYSMFEFIKEKTSRENLSEIFFNPSAPFYQMAGWEQTKSVNLSVEYQASSIWTLFIDVKGELDVQIGEQVLPYLAYLAVNQPPWNSFIATYPKRGTKEFVEKVMECYEKLYNCYKDNDVEAFRHYLNHTDLPRGVFFEGFKEFVNMQTYNTRLLNGGYREIEERNTQIVMLENVVEVQSREIIELNDDNLQLKKQCTVYEKRAETLDLIVKEQDISVHNLHTDKARKEAEIERLTCENKNLNGEVQGLRNENENLSGQVQGLRNENENLSGQVQGLRNENENLSGQVQGLRNENENLSGQVQGLRSETERQEEQIERVLVKYEKLDAEYLEQMEKYRDVVAENKRLKEENKGYRNQSKTSNDEESDDTNERNRLTNENFQLKEKVQSLELKNKDQDSLINILYGTNEYQKVKLEKLTGENKDLLDNNKNLEEGKKYLLERYQELFEKHEKLEEESDDTNENNTGGGPQFF